jgi:hypothetical protein
MNGLRAIAMTMSVVLLAGCAIHPLPEDFAGVQTYQIVRQIRCEARQAVIDLTLEYLRGGTKVDAISRSIGERFDRNPETIDNLNPDLFKGPVHDALKVFWDTGIAYNFNLEMTEVNNINTSFNILKPFTNASGTVGFGAGLDRQRQNTRTFTVTDTFGNLVKKLPRNVCAGQVKGENYIYPMTGTIGINNMIQDFVFLSLFGNLAGKAEAPDGPPTMVDALEFQTFLSGNASPTITFSPVGKALSVSNASLTGTISRKDLHKVVVGLALSKASQGQLPSVRGAQFGTLLTASGGAAERTAAIAVDQYLTQKLFNPTIVVNQ